MTGTGREFAYGPVDFEQVRKKLYQLTGIKLADSKDSMVYSRLVRRLRTLGVKGFSDYLRRLDENPEEEEFFINALTTNLTSFFREPHHFDILADFLREYPGQVKRIWCAAASTGEEPYSIAMTVAETQGRFDTSIEIIASDIDSQVLASASAGVYAMQRIESVSKERRKLFFQRGKGGMAGKVRVVPELQRMVQFRRINLLDSKWEVTPPVDVLFCRNVMIYFDRQTQENILRRMVSLMSPQGLYVAGHSENFNHMSHLLVSTGKTTYRPLTGSAGV